MPAESPSPFASGPVRNLAIASCALTAAFAWPLFQWARFALGSDLYSHTALIPLVSAYLLQADREKIFCDLAPDHLAGLVFGALGLTILGLRLWLNGSGVVLHSEDNLALSTSAYLLLFVALWAGLLGRTSLRAAAFPLGFLVFMVPLPAPLLNGIEFFLQHTSAAAAYAMFLASGTPVYHDGLTFMLPNITLHVAPECSGIRSSLVLFITSVLAGHLFLRSRWKRFLLPAAVIPLSFIRNGFRVFVLGELCVRVSPDMIDTWIHHQGGPVFFLLSLVPFFILLWLLYRTDKRKEEGKGIRG